MQAISRRRDSNLLVWFVNIYRGLVLGAGLEVKLRWNYIILCYFSCDCVLPHFIRSPIILCQFFLCLRISLILQGRPRECCLEVRTFPECFLHLSCSWVFPLRPLFIPNSYLAPCSTLGFDPLLRGAEGEKFCSCIYFRLIWDGVPTTQGPKVSSCLI